MMAEHIYSAPVLEHFRHPRNAGRLDAKLSDVGSGLAGAPEQGAVLRLQIQVEESGIIGRTRFKAYGCGSTIAAASWTAEWLEGKSLDQALALHSADLVRALELPPVKTYSSILAIDAVRAAVNDYKRKQE